MRTSASLAYKHGADRVGVDIVMFCDDDDMFCDEDLSGRSAHEALAALSTTVNEPWAIIIGPEGGFDENERSRIKEMSQTTVVSLGPRVLRADTAAMAALTLWQSAVGDW